MISAAQATVDLDSRNVCQSSRSFESSLADGGSALFGVVGKEVRLNADGIPKFRKEP